MPKMKFIVPDVDMLHELLDVLKGLNPQTSVSADEFETRMANIIHYTENSYSDTVQIYFYSEAKVCNRMLEYGLSVDFFHHDETTQGHQHIKDVPAFIASSGVPAENYDNVVLHVHSPGEMRAALKRLLDIGEITQTEYESCFPKHAPDQYVRHRTIFLTAGVVTFGVEVRNTRYCDEGIKAPPRVVDMEKFLSNGELRPHYHLHLEWVQDTSVQVEMRMGDGSWAIVTCPSFSPTCEYRRYVPPIKSADELTAEQWLAGLSEGVLAEVKRQLGVQNEQV